MMIILILTTAFHTRGMAHASDDFLWPLLYVLSIFWVRDLRSSGDKVLRLKKQESGGIVAFLQ